MDHANRNLYHGSVGGVGRWTASALSPSCVFTIEAQPFYRGAAFLLFGPARDPPVVSCRHEISASVSLSNLIFGIRFGFANEGKHQS